MKILLALQGLPFPKTDGIKIQDYNMLISLKKLGYQCDILAFQEDFVDDTSYEGTEVFLVEKNTQLKNIFGRIKNYFKGMPMPIGGNYSKKFANKLNELLRGGEYGLVILSYFNMMYYLKNAGDIPVLLFATDSPAKTYGNFYAEAKTSLKRMYYKSAYRLSCKTEENLFYKAKMILVVSEIDGKYIREQNPQNNVAVIPIQTADEHFEFNKNSFHGKSPKLLTIGDVTIDGVREGLSAFLRDVYPVIKDRYPGLIFDALVKHPELVSNVPSGVNAHGFVTNEEYARLIRNADILIFPDKTGNGQKNRVLDAFAKTKCVIGTNAALDGFNYEDGENVILAQDADDFIAAIDSCFKTPALIQKIGENAYEFAIENHSAKIIVKKWKDLMRSIMEEEVKR